MEKLTFYEQSADTYLSAAISDNTRLAYEKGWAYWIDFCACNNIVPLPAKPKDIVKFVVDQATKPRHTTGRILSMGTVILWRSAISWKHTEAGYSSPTNSPEVISVMKGLARIKGMKCRRVKALREHHIKAMLDKCGKTPIGLRDAAVIAVGFAGALRRSEICALTVEDISIMEPTDSNGKRMFLHIRKSKTDQEGQGQKVAVPEGKVLQPIRRLQDWLKVSNIAKGPVFQTMRRGGTLRGLAMHHSDIPRLLKYYGALIGLDPKEIAGHSLRAGFVTSAVAHHARLDKIMEVTRHRNPSTVMKYIRDADIFNDHAGEKFL